MKDKGRMLLLVCLSIVVILVGLPAITVCAKTVTGEPIKIGSINSITGMQASTTIPEAVELASEEFAEVAGRPIKIISVDDGSNPKLGLERAHRLVEVDKVDITVGPRFGPVVYVVWAYLCQQQVVALSPVMETTYEIASKVTPEFSCIYRIAVMPDQMTALLKWAYDNRGFKKFNIIISDITIARDAVEAAKAAVSDMPGAQILSEIIVPLGEMDMTPHITTLDKTADATFFWIAGPPGLTLPKTYSDFGLKMPLMRIDGGEYAWDEQLEKSPQMEGVIFCTSYVWTIDNPTNKRFVEKYKNKFGHFPDANAGMFYSDIQLIHDVLQKTGGDASPDKFHQAITGPTYDLPWGPIRYDDNRWPDLRNYYICEIQRVNGVLTPVIVYQAEYRK